MSIISKRLNKLQTTPLKTKSSATSGVLYNIYSIYASPHCNQITIESNAMQQIKIKLRNKIICLQITSFFGAALKGLLLLVVLRFWNVFCIHSGGVYCIELLQYNEIKCNATIPNKTAKQYACLQITSCFDIALNS